jgi:hypothetical protein
VLDVASESDLSDRLRTDPNSSGTHIRVQVSGENENDLLGYTLTHPSTSCFESLLRLYTPVGQCNDFVMHPAFHTLRSKDLGVSLRLQQTSGEIRGLDIDFDILRLKGPTYFSFPNFVNQGQPHGSAVHTIHRIKRSGHVYLTAADIQGTQWFHSLEESLQRDQSLAGYINEEAKLIREIPRGFWLVLSGGMKSEHLARPVRGNTTNYRGFVLAETARPTLGRKHVEWISAQRLHTQRRATRRVTIQFEGGHYRNENPRLILLLPLGGSATIYKVLLQMFVVNPPLPLPCLSLQPVVLEKPERCSSLGNSWAENSFRT